MAVCSGITRSGTRITIAYPVGGDVKGNSFDDAYTYDDIYDTDQANGWGLFAKVGDTYIAHCSLVFSGQNTYFKSDNTYGFVLIFEGEIDDTILFDGQEANIHLGDHMWTSVIRHDYSTTGANHQFKTGTTDLYDIDLRNIIITGFVFVNIKEGVYNSVEFGSSVTNIFSDTTLSNVFVFNRPATVRGTPTSADNVQVINPGTSSIAFDLMGNATFRNAKALGTRIADYRARASYFNLCTFVDSNIDVSSVQNYVSFDGTAEVHNKTTFNATIANANDGTLTIYDTDDNVVYTEELTSDSMTEQEILFEKNDITVLDSVQTNDITDYTPFKLIVTKDGYDDLEIPGITVTAGEQTVVRGEMVKTQPPATATIEGSVSEESISGEVDTVEITGSID